MIGLFRASRDRRGSDRFVDVKIALFTLGAVIIAVAMLTEKDWIMYPALAVLLVGVVLRFIPSRDGRNGPSDDHSLNPPGTERR